jgi:hypothetical protein
MLISVNRFKRIISGSAIKFFLTLSLLTILHLSLFAQEQAQKVEITDDVVVYFEATRCYGTCPVFSYKIHEDGTARYEGKEYVENEGIYETTVSSADMEDLIEIFYKYNFFDFQDRYTDHVSDLPTIYVYLSHDGKRKKITDYHGAPESLKDMEIEIVEKLRSLKWKKVEEKGEEGITN